MKRKLRRRDNRPISNINVVPYLDVMLVLLVIFMITAPLFNQGIVELPSVGDAPLASQQVGAMEVVYEDTEQYRLIDHDKRRESTHASLESLLSALAEESVLRPDGMQIVISAGKQLQYGAVMTLLGQLHENGYAQVGLNVHSEQ